MLNMLILQLIFQFVIYRKHPFPSFSVVSRWVSYAIFTIKDWKAFYYRVKYVL